ncbi:zonadhesin-like, partial [Mizuhopecten yessoensis]
MDVLEEIPTGLHYTAPATVMRCQREIIKCSSWEYKKESCETKQFYIHTVKLKEKLSDSKCTFGETFYLRKGKLVVKEGCRGKFEVSNEDCEEKPKNKCNGKNTKYDRKLKKCVCMKGFIGNADEECFGTCRCYASGDPHYYTFDGAIIHFQGTCKYTLAQFIDTEGPYSFSVEVENEHRNDKDDVSFTKCVEVLVYGQTIRLGQDRIVHINGGVRDTPIITESGNIKIGISGSDVRLSTSLGLEVTFDGKHKVSVMAPKAFKGQYKGLCGDCDDDKNNDYRTEGGIDVTQDKNRYNSIGDSYAVPSDDEDDDVCLTEHSFEECPNSDMEVARGDDYCGWLLPTNQKSPFFKCIQEQNEVEKAQELYASCTLDVCAFMHNGNEKDLNRTICSALEMMAVVCDDDNDPLQWRPDMCKIPCGKNMQFMSAVSSCPNNCVERDAETNCDMSASRVGCGCAEGFILDGNRCVLPNQCGCLENNIYYNLGREKVSNDCTTVSHCVSTNGNSSMIFKEKRNPCDEQANCLPRGESRKCVCKPGYIGNGEKCEAAEKCDKVIECSADKGGYKECTEEMQIRRARPAKPDKKTKRKCKRKRDYGVKNGVLWVKKGCGGTFKVKGYCKTSKVDRCGENEERVKGKCVCQSGYQRDKKGKCKDSSSNCEQILNCESEKGRYTKCPLKERFKNIDLIQERPGSKCVKNKSFGLRRGNMWVKEGCRGTFKITKKGKCNSSKTCGVNAEKRKGKCRCKKGYSGSHTGRCE